jgi:O-antigen ligase
LVLGILLGAGLVGAVGLEVIYGTTDILRESVGRFASIVGTEVKPENTSNISRLVEAAGVLEHIRQSPWIGHGVGYTFLVRHTLFGNPSPQWWIDENYLLIWVKQGAIGVAAYLWLLWTGVRFGIRHARQRHNP